jgi:DNA-binding transcriptional LysR family regulator
MFLSQPAMSRVFDRLQEMFKDELLVRTDKGYEPTKRASALYLQLNDVLPRIDGLFHGADFKPAQATDQFRIAAGPYASLWLVPRLIQSLARQAPNIRVEISISNNATQRLEANQIDLILSGQEAPRNLPSSALFEEPYMCLLRMDHPLAKRRLTLRRYLAARHISGQQAILDERLNRQGYERDIRVRVVDFFPIGILVERTDLIATLALRVARQLEKVSRIRMVPAPPEVGRFRYTQVWHSRDDTNPAHRWLRKVVQRACVKIF